MDVTTPEQAKIAQAAGACAVMALERIPADIRAAGGVSRMSDPKMIKAIQKPFLFLLWLKSGLGILWKHKFWKPSALIMLMKVKFYHRLTILIISIKLFLKCRLSAELKT